MGLDLVVNGRAEQVSGVSAGDTLRAVVAALDLKADRIAIEVNGEIAGRDSWGEMVLAPGDRLEIVHFVGGGCSASKAGQIL